MIKRNKRNSSERMERSEKFERYFRDTMAGHDDQLYPTVSEKRSEDGF